MFTMKIIHESWYCDDCGFIDDFSVICNYGDKTIKEYYDGHFGNGSLSYEYDNIDSFRVLIEPFMDEFKNQGIEILEIKEDEIFLTDFDYKDTIMIIRTKINNQDKVFTFMTSAMNYEKNPDKDKNLYQEFFKFIEIEFNMENESNEQINETDWLY